MKAELVVALSALMGISAYDFNLAMVAACTYVWSMRFGLSFF
jgi:hypothetical protein